MLTFARKYGHNVTSQNGENGIIAECLNRINPSLKVAVEFGAPDMRYCSNIWPLGDDGWRLHYYDDNSYAPGVERKLITVDNINDLPKCSVMSIDCDGVDYELWKAYNGTPDIVIIEINSSFAPMIDHYSHEDGASYRTMANLAKSKGYFVLCHTGNLICVLDKHRDLFPEVGNSDAVENYSLFFNTSWLC
jgi:hypothetical protein